MEENKVNLEKKILYRLGKVLYWTYLILIFVFTVVIYESSGIVSAMYIFLINYSILNLLKESLMYIFFGVKFSWSWIKKPFYFLYMNFKKLANKGEKIQF